MRLAGGLRGRAEVWLCQPRRAERAIHLGRRLEEALKGSADGDCERVDEVGVLQRQGEPAGSGTVDPGEVVQGRGPVDAVT